MDNTARIEALEAAAGGLKDRDHTFARSLVDSYNKYNKLSDKQWYWVDELIRRAGGSIVHTKDKANETEEIFNGTAIRDLLVQASSKLKFPKLRYQTDAGQSIIFGFVADVSSRWHRCTFIDNGKKGTNKVRYGFINSHGGGNLRRESEQGIKTAIRKIAANPIESAKLSGQAYKSCCFCGLELTNKSSLHHGYGPICADNWGLPWGDTGDEAADEAAATEELKHISLTDLE